MTGKASISVVGAGLMGHGIAWIFAAAGHAVRVYDASPAARASLHDRLAAIDALLETKRTGSVTVHDTLRDVATRADFIIEAAPEILDLKQTMFVELEQLAPADCVLASNTSAMPIGELSARMADRSRLVGAHFWNPPHLVPLVEVIETPYGNAGNVEKVMALLKAAGRRPVHVQRDIAGFIGNRLQHALKREAIALVASGVCSAETLDNVVKYGFGSRLSVVGPLEQSDMVGLELTLAIHETLIADLDVTPGPHPMLEDLVAAGKLGMKTGEGFRSWTPQQAEQVRQCLSQFLAATARQHASKQE